MSESETIRLRGDGVTWRESDGEVIVLDERTWGYITVNRTGARLWPRLCAGTSDAELVAELMGEYGLEEERARADVTTFLATLREHDLLTRGG